MVDYLQASIGPAGSPRGVDFEWLSADGEGGRRVALVDFVGRDEPGHQDLGRAQLRDTIEGFVFGANWLDRLEELEAELRVPGIKTLTHPIKGQFDVRVTGWRWSQRSSVQQRADVSITFVRVGEEIPAVFDVPELSATQVVAAREAIEADAGSRWKILNRFSQLTQAAVNKLSAANDALLVTKGRINAQFAVVDQLAFAISDLDNSLTSLINAPREIAGRFANLTLEVFGLVSTATSIPGRKSGPKLVVDAVRDLAEFGSDDTPRPRTTPERVEHDDTMRAINADLRALALLGAASVLADVEYQSAQTASNVRDDMAELFDGVLAELPADPFSAMSDVLATLSRFLTARAQNLPAITTYTPPTTQPAVVIAHELYGDATRADEIVARNRIVNPTFVPGGVPLEVLAV